MNAETTRRPLKSRGTKWAALAARGLLKMNIQPNTISIASVFFASIAWFLFFSVDRSSIGNSATWYYFLAAVCIQLRLLCNLMDGMVAIEGGKKTPTGDIYNELPDRIADVIILVAAGYSLSNEVIGPILGWIAAVMALVTAYIRVLGVSLGADNNFCGPMAKPHRMAALTVGCLLEAFLGGLPWLMLVLIVIIVGSVVTSIRRTMFIAKSLS